MNIAERGPKDQLGADRLLAGRRQRLLRLIETELQRGDAQIAALARIDRAILDRDPLPETLQTACDDIVAAVGALSASVYYRSGGKLTLVVSASGVESSPSIALTSKLDAAILHPGVVQHTGLQHLKNVAINPIVAGKTELRSIRVDRESESPFAYLFLRTKPGEFNGHEEAVLHSVAAQLAIAIRGASLFPSDTERAVEELLGEIDSVFFSTTARTGLSTAAVTFTSASKILERVADEAKAILGDVQVQVLFPVGDQRMRVVYSPEVDDVGFTVSASSVSGRAAAGKRTVPVTDVRDDPDYVQFLGRDMRSEYAVPILLSGQLVAVLNLESPEIGFFEGLPAILASRYAKEVAFVVAFTRIYDDILQSLSRRHAEETFVVMGMQAANLVHRLKNDLGLIRSAAQHIKRVVMKKDNVGQEAVLEGIAEIEQLVDETRRVPELYRQSFEELDRIDINKNVELVRSLPKYLLPTIAFELRLTSPLPSVPAFLFRDVLENLLDNSVDAIHSKFGGDPGGKIVVRTAVRQHERTGERQVRLQVIDNGSGMEHKDREQAFRPAFTTKNGQRQKVELRGGMGLGLFLVKQAVLRVGGDVKIYGTPGEGTTVELVLPLGKMEGGVDADEG